ncbi:hypothetical protein G6F57_016951 [Rhizopus arrhizus]|nr:hypothetical protein G6F57_016951 [Rhizopus arrhizus]
MNVTPSSNCHRNGRFPLRAPDGAASAQRHPDDQLRAEHESCQLRRHHAAERAIAEPRQAGHGAAHYQQHDPPVGGVQAQVAATRFIVAQRHQDAPAVAAHHDPRQQGHHRQRSRRNHIPGLKRQVERLVARQAGRRPGIGAAGQHQLHQHDGQHQRDDRREEWRRPPIERQPPRHQRKQRRGTHCRQCGQRSGTRRKPIMREGQAGGIGAHAKKGRLAERQMAAP